MTLLDDLRAAGLTGRGGAAFATDVKIAGAREHGTNLIVNACDGEIGAAKDAWIVAHHLPELLAGARLIVPGGNRIRYAAQRGSATAARLAAAGCDVLEVPKRYVSSEESALVSLANVGLARPMTKRAPIVHGGRDSRGRRFPPTLVLNAETVWRVAQIADRGPSWFRAQGTRAEPGPRLATVHGAVLRPGVVETEAGVPIADLLGVAAALPPRAELVWIGGLGGTLIPIEDTLRLRWRSDELAAYGTSIGPGVIEVLDPRVCPVEHVDRVLAYAAGESAGQCGPCMFGLPALAADWHELATERAGTGAADARLQRRVGLLPGRGACRFPDGVARFVSSARIVLARHLAAHGDGSCPTRSRGRSHVA